MADKKRATVEVQVIGHDVWHDKPTIKMNVVEWPSDYGTTLYGVSEEAKDALWLGFTGKVVLDGRLKAGKDADKPYNWFWDFVELAGDTYPSGGSAEYEEPPPDGLFGEPNTSNNADKPLPTQRQEIAFPSPSSVEEQKSRNIHASVALTESVNMKVEGISPSEVCVNALLFYQALRYMATLSGLEEAE